MINQILLAETSEKTRTNSHFPPPSATFSAGNQKLITHLTFKNEGILISAESA